MSLFIWAASGYIDDPANSVKNEEWADRPHELGYFTDGRDGFILHSLGPDGRLDLPDLKQALAQPEIIKPHRYDPTNGMVSPGDIIRIDHVLPSGK